MNGQEKVLFTCPRRGHVYARVIETGDGPIAVIANSAYTDKGPDPGTVRVRRSDVERQLAIREDEAWSTDVVCGCNTAARLLTSGACQTELDQWRIHDRPKVRRVVLDNTA
jgi:hypothetical protein